MLCETGSHMRPPSAADLSIFLSIAQHLNLSRAAIDLGLTPSALSHALRALENRLGVRLFNRTTRSVALTEAGERLYTRLRPAFRDIDDALEDLNSFRDRPSGSLRITASRQACELVLLPIVSPFLLQYPDIRLEIVESDAFVDVVAGGFDAGVRFGNRIEGDMASQAIGPNMRSIVVGAPAFFERHAVPQKPEDLRGIPCIRHRFPSGAIYRWEFERGGIPQEIEVNGPLTLGDVSLMLGPATQGLGLAYIFEEMAARYLAEGSLIQVLADWCPFYPGMHLYYPGRRHVPAPLRAFIDFARQARQWSK